MTLNAQKRPPASGRPANGQLPDAWLENVQVLCAAFLAALVVFCWVAPRYAGRVTWTVVVAALPLAIVLFGYHRWRRICPIAFIAHLPARLGRPGHRRASGWLQANYYSVAFGVFLFSLWLRLVAINGNGTAIVVFLLLLAAAAFASGAWFTGKTWCNYICPVSFVEKIYTEPRGIRPTANSQCPKCTACKPACPDINEENGYWKEARLQSKREVYFAFPGTVFAFYLYYYLQSGTWAYYMGGRWTNEPSLVRTAFLPGHDGQTAGFSFLPVEPRALAAALTLVIGALAGYALFSQLEGRLGDWLRGRALGMDETGVRHVTFTIAAFAAFVTFYSFAGAPTLRLVTGLPHLFQILVVLSASLFLFRRLGRNQRAYAEETLARQIIRRWEWTDMKPPEDLHEAFLIHTIRSQARATGYSQVLDIYKDAVREVVASGFVSRAEVQRLESLRNQMQISKADHETVMAALDEEERARISDPAGQVSAEKRLQLETYSRALASYLERVTLTEGSQGAPDDRLLRQLRVEYAVTEEEHAAVLQHLLRSAGGLSDQLVQALGAIEAAANAVAVLERDGGDAGSGREGREAPERARRGRFLIELLRRRQTLAADGLLRGLSFASDADASGGARLGLLAGSRDARETAVRMLGATLPEAVAARLLEAHREAAEREAGRDSLAGILHAQLASADPYVRAVALHLLGEIGEAAEETVAAMIADDHSLVRETAMSLRMATTGAESAPLTTVEKMAALRSVPLFVSLEPEHLADLARASSETDYPAAAPLCSEGDPGNEVFVVLRGSVAILRGQGGAQSVVGKEGVGACIGEMAVLDPAPRAATVLAGESGARVLRVNGPLFREAMKANPPVAHEVIRALVQRLRGAQASPVRPGFPPAPACEKPGESEMAAFR